MSSITFRIYSSFVKLKCNSNKKQTMPYRSGAWGPEAQERSKRRLEYFHAYDQRKYILHKDEILARCADYYRLHRKEILAREKLAYSKTYNQSRYQLHKDEIKAKCATYYKLHREEILKKKATGYYKKKLTNQ
jgi:hypothetical protein